MGRTTLPSITAVLRGASRTKSGPWFTPEHRERGKVVHAATLVADLGAEPVIPDQWRPYLDGWLAFTAAVRPKWLELEQPRYRVDLPHPFAGTPDRVGLMNGHPCVLEIKTGRAASWHKYQTAAQDILLGGPMTGRRRLVCYLPGDGSFSLSEHDSPVDYLTFLDDLREVTHARTTDWIDCDDVGADG